MREVDFVPPWYRDLLRRKRATVGYLSVVAMLVILVAGALARQSEVRAAEQQLAATDAQLAATRSDLQRLDALRQLLDQWRRQEQVLTSTGVNVEASRLLAALTKVVPADTPLTGITFAVSEPEREAAPATAPSSADQGTPQATGKRRLNVSLRGVAPGELAVANVLAGSASSRSFDT